MTLEEMYEIRRNNMIYIINTYCDGMNKVLSDKTGLLPQTVAHYKSGKNTITEKTARLIESGCGLPWGAMDCIGLQMADTVTASRNVAILAFLSVVNWAKLKKNKDFNDDILRGVFAQAYDILLDQFFTHPEITIEMIEESRNIIKNKVLN